MQYVTAYKQHDIIEHTVLPDNTRISYKMIFYSTTSSSITHYYR